MKIIEIVTPIENFFAVENIITRHQSEILWVNIDEDKKDNLFDSLSLFQWTLKTIFLKE